MSKTLVFYEALGPHSRDEQEYGHKGALSHPWSIENFAMA